MKSVISYGKISVIAFVVASGSLVGCGKVKEPWEDVFPAKGTVNLNGKPLAGAVVSLVPEDTDVPDTVRPRATTGDDGTYQLSTYANADGAPEGKYKVLVLHYPVVGSKENPHAGPNDLPAKYSKADTTDLRLEVTAPQTDLSPLELKK